MGPEVPGIRKVLGVHGILRYWGSVGPGGYKGPRGPGVPTLGPTFLSCPAKTRLLSKSCLLWN